MNQPKNQRTNLTNNQHPDPPTETTTKKKQPHQSTNQNNHQTSQKEPASQKAPAEKLEKYQSTHPPKQPTNLKKQHQMNSP